MTRRAVITGIGLVTALGRGSTEIFRRVRDGEAGRCVDWATTRCYVVADLDASQVLGSAAIAKRTARATHLVAAGFQTALAESGLDPKATDPERAGVILGTSVGGLGAMVDAAVDLEVDDRPPSRFLVPGVMLSSPNGYVSIVTGFSGSNYAVSSACSSSSHAIGSALNEIRAGLCDVVVTGGFESPFSGGEGARRDVIGLGFAATKALSPSGIVRPFAGDRDGFLLGEGACILLLEEIEHARRRGADAIAEIAGYGRSSDGYHMVAPHPDGDGAYRSMQLALADAGIDPSEVDFVHAHATGTPAGDIAEANALRRVFGGRVPPTTSTKAATGHALGGSGAIGVAFAALALRSGRLPPTLNHEIADPAIDIDVVSGIAREVPDARVAITNAFAFGGTNASLVLRTP